MGRTFTGTICAFGFDFVPNGWVKCDGRSLNVSESFELDSLLLSRFGGDGYKTFCVPDLCGISPTNMKSAVDLGLKAGIESSSPEAGDSVPLNYCMCLNGAYPPRSNKVGRPDIMPGTITAFGFDYNMPGWLPCDGRDLKIDAYSTLFSTIGYRYSRCEGEFFTLPDMRMKSIVHREDVGEFNRGKIAVVKPGSSTGKYKQQSIALNYSIFCGHKGGVDKGEHFIGSIVPFACEQVPSGWLPCDGTVLDISSNPELFSLIGVKYGGDGHVNFRLPDLRNRVTVGDGGEDTKSFTGKSGDIVDMFLSDSGSLISVNYCINTKGLFPLRE